MHWQMLVTDKLWYSAKASDKVFCLVNKFYNLNCFSSQVDSTYSFLYTGQGQGCWNKQKPFSQINKSQEESWLKVIIIVEEHNKDLQYNL